MATIFKLVVKSGDELNKIYTFNKGKNSIGRDPKSDIVIDDIEISRNHLEINLKGNTVLLKDLNSTNGTFLNGKRLDQAAEVTDGDLISLGKNIVLEFVVEKESAGTESQQIDEVEPTAINLDEKVQLDEQTIFDQDPLENDILEQKTELAAGKSQEKHTSKLKPLFRKIPTWALILITALGFLVIFCLIPLLVIEVTDQWCNLFAGFFNSMSPGVCP